jgi:succinoglycan biosynthesis protein ExoA
VVPCFNEQETVQLLLEAIYLQTYPRRLMEVLIMNGRSTDQTVRRIEEYQATHAGLCVRVLPNEKRIIPAGLNEGIKAAQGTVIVRLDAHSMPQPDYVARSVVALQQGLGDNVGGAWNIRPGKTTWIAQAIAQAAAHPLGVGDARYRVGGKAGAVETVPFGAFQRDLALRLGGFDESLLVNEDYEFNTRIRQNGGTIWFDPEIKSTYFARPSLEALARQYWRYGYWKQRMLRRYPATIRWRQALPPGFVLALITMLCLAPWWSLARLGLVVIPGFYLLILALAGTAAAIKKRQPGLIPGLPVAIAVMHLAWGAGFLWSLAGF